MRPPLRPIVLAVLLVVAGLAASLAGIFVGEGYRIYAAKLAGSVLLAGSLVGAWFIVRGTRPTPSRSLGRAALLVLDGVALTLVGVAIAEIDDAPGAALIGFVVMLLNLAAAFFVARRVWQPGPEGPRTSTPNPGLAALLAINGVILMLAFWMLGQFIDPPGAPGIGALLLAANMIAAIAAARPGRQALA
jgi:hypothetical protein